MIPLFSKEQFDNAKQKDLLFCQCVNCNQPFQRTKKIIKQALNPNSASKNNFCSKTCSNQTNKKNFNECLCCGNKFETKVKSKKFCSKECLSKSKIKTLIDVECENCNTTFQKTKTEANRSNKHFCSRSCSASYNNKNKTKGNRRSKLEIWVEEQLTQLYPNLPIDFNKKNAIGSELDVYIPSLNIAFELNGLFHYEPIFGVNKLNQIQENDKNKFQKCYENKIDLCIIDVSKQTYFKPSTSQKYLDVIINIVNERLI
jgi:hypothetical protein